MWREDELRHLLSGAGAIEVIREDSKVGLIRRSVPQANAAWAIGRLPWR
jgi:hypothetical protein